MTITVNIKAENKSFSTELKMNKLVQFNDLFLVEIPEIKENIETLEIFPVSFMTNGSVVFSNKNMDILPQMLVELFHSSEYVELDVICSFYMNHQGELSLGTLHHLPETLELKTNGKRKLIDYGNYLNWCKLSNKTPLSLFAFAQNEVLTGNNYEVKKPDYAARSFT